MNIDDHIVKYLLEETTEKENKELLTWVNSADENKKHFTDMCSIWNSTNVSSDAFSLEQGFRKFKNRVAEMEPQKEIEIARNPKYKLRLLYSSIAVAASIAIFVSILIFNIKDNTVKDEIVFNNSTSVKNLILPDSTIVSLKQNSSIQYPSVFSENKRSVSLDGEAFFNVSKNKGIFEVATKNTTTTVLGTSFLINTNGIGNKTDIFVKTGKVLFVAEKDSVLLKKGEKASFNRMKKELAKEQITSENYLSWKTGKLVFKDEKLSSVFKDLENHYNVSFTISTPQIMDCRLTAKYDNKPLDSVLESLEVLYGLFFEKSNNTVSVSGNSCNE